MSAPPRTSTGRRFLDSLDTYSATAPKPSAAGGAGAAPGTTLPRSSSNHGGLGSSVGAGSKPPASASAAGGAPAKAAPNAAEAQSVLDFLDEITQRSSTPTASVKTSDRSLEKKSSVPSGLGRSTSRQNLTGAGGTGAAGQVPPRRSTDSVRSQWTVGGTPVGGGGTALPASPRSAAATAPQTASIASASAPPAASEDASKQQQQQGGGWGWSSMWSQASNVVQQASHLAQQARTAAEEQVKTATSGGAGGVAGGIAGIGGGLMKALGENEQAKKWSEGVISYAKGAHLDQLGKDLKSTTLKSLTDLLNAVAPPIAEHEVIQVSLSHDMVGYDGVETLVYRGLAKIMDQIEGGSLVVNKGTEEKPREVEGDEDVRDLNIVDGLTEAWKLAEASVDQLIKTTYKPPAPSSSSADGATVPVTTCPVYMRIQPCLAPVPFLPPACLPSTSSDPNSSKVLFFLLLLRDPTHNLVHTSMSQSMPASWLDIPFEENEWVEDQMVEIIRRSVEIIGQEYISHRMRAQAVAISQARAEAQQALDHHNAEQEQQEQEKTEEEASTAAQEARVGVV
ncbi:hypothetical protein RTBOTA2_002077 [Rhodotorula toruloides]|nr:hypothetical protein RTBOTA2_002077 [Rhodotorula toruloides]